MWEHVDSLLAGSSASLDVVRAHRVELLEARRRRAAGIDLGDGLIADQTRVAVNEMAAPGLLARVRAAYDGPLLLHEGTRGRARLRRARPAQLRRPRPADRRRRGRPGRAARGRLPGGLRRRDLRGHPPPAAALVARPADRRRAAHARELAGRDPRAVDRGAVRRRRAEPARRRGHHDAAARAPHARARRPRLGAPAARPPRQSDRRRGRTAAQRRSRGRAARAPLGLPAHVADHASRRPRRRRRRGALGGRRAVGAPPARRARAHRVRVAREGPAGAGLGHSRPERVPRAIARRGKPHRSSAARGWRCATPAARGRSTSNSRRWRDERAASCETTTCTGGRSTAR